MRLTLLNQYYTPDISPTAHLTASLAEHRAAIGDLVTVITSRGGYIDLSKNSAHLEKASNPRHNSVSAVSSFAPSTTCAFMSVQR